MTRQRIHPAVAHERDEHQVPLPDGTPVKVVVIELDPASPYKTRAMLRWLDVLTVRNMVAGRRLKSDRWVNLVFQGQLSTGSRVTVCARYDDPVQVALIFTRINEQNPHDILHRLLAVEAGAA